MFFVILNQDVEVFELLLNKNKDQNKSLTLHVDDFNLICSKPLIGKAFFKFREQELHEAEFQGEFQPNILARLLFNE